MRVGINIPDDLYERFKPLKGTYNLSQICRDAMKSQIDSFEKSLKQAKSDGMEVLTDKFWLEYSKKTFLDWEQIGRENARKWMEGASLENLEDFVHNINVHERKGAEPGEFLGSWRQQDEDRYYHAASLHKDWFDRQYDLDSTKNYQLIAEREYNRGYITYIKAIWSMLDARIKADEIARAKSKQQPNIELPKDILSSPERNKTVKGGK